MALLVPLALLARYTLFDDASEFRLFSEQLKRYVAPLVIGFVIVLIGGAAGVIGKRIDKLQQERLATAFFWLSSIILALAVVAIFANVKMQRQQSVQSDKVVIL
jgi:xanthine/uracil permease